jgi:hypothetical protein
MSTFPAQRVFSHRLLLLAGCLALPFSTDCQLTSADQVVRPPAPRGSGGSYGRDVGSADEPARDAPYGPDLGTADEPVQDGAYGGASGRDAGNADEPIPDVPNVRVGEDADSIDACHDASATDSSNLRTTDLGLVEDSLESGEVVSSDALSLGTDDACAADLESADADSVDAGR